MIGLDRIVQATRTRISTIDYYVSFQVRTTHFEPSILLTSHLCCKTQLAHGSVRVIQVQVRFYRHGQWFIPAGVDTAIGALALRVAYLDIGAPVITTSVMRLRRLRKDRSVLW